MPITTKRCPCFGLDFHCQKCFGTGAIQYEKKSRQYKEAKEQTTIAGYMRKNFPDVPFETVKHEGKKEQWERAQHKAQNSQDSFPDTRIYFPHVTLMIENKKAGTSLTLKDGSCATDHIQNQYNTHKRLFSAHTKVYFAVGITDAITLIEQGSRGVYPPMQVFKDRIRKQDRDADAFFDRYDKNF